MLTRLATALLAAAIALNVATPIALAQSGAAKSAASRREPAGYKESVTNALAEFEQANFVEAREHFLRAHRLFPNARTLRGLGMSEYELRNYIDAASYLRQALASEEKRLDGRLRDETAALLARANAYLGTLRLHLQPTTATVRVDGFATELPSSGELTLQVGDHVLDIQAEGRLPERRAIKIEGEQVLEVRVALAEPALAEPVAAAPARPTREDLPPSAPPTPVYKRWWLWTTIAVVAAGGATAAVLLTRKTERRERPIETANTPEGGAVQPARMWSF